RLCLGENPALCAVLPGTPARLGAWRPPSRDTCGEGLIMAAIDVLMPVRNGIGFLGESIESIIAQSYTDWRLLILDHGSSDGSADLGRRYAERDRRIHVLSMPGAQGLGGLLNAGLEYCDSRYVMRHDADDIALPNRMELMNQFYAANSQY